MDTENRHYFPSFSKLIVLLFLIIPIYMCGCTAGTSVTAELLQNEKLQTLSSQKTITLPDVSNGDTNQGFTCTGLTYSPQENCFYVVNFGQQLPTDFARYPTIVKMSAEWNVLSEISIYEHLPENANIQGISYDSSDDTLWFADVTTNKIYNISNRGEQLATIECAGLNGIAYDSRTDTLWVINNSLNSGDVSVKNISKSGDELITIKLSGIYHSDQLFLDEDNDLLYFSAGADYHGDNFIYSISLTDYTYSKEYVLKDSYAIEGISIIENTLFVCNDGLYHSSFSNTNEVKVYSLDQ